jgi:hypothetical protein
MAIRDGCWELCHPPVRRFFQTAVQRFTNKRELTMVTGRWLQYGEMFLKWRLHGIAVAYPGIFSGGVGFKKFS